MDKIRIAGLEITVLGREYPDVNDSWDANWLNVEILFENEASRIKAQGPLIRNTELKEFKEELKNIYETLKGNAELKCLEPNMNIKMIVKIITATI